MSEQSNDIPPQSKPETKQVEAAYSGHQADDLIGSELRLITNHIAYPNSEIATKECAEEGELGMSPLKVIPNEKGVAEPPNTEEIPQDYVKASEAPEGWFTIGGLAKALGTEHRVVKRIIAKLVGDDPLEKAVGYKDGGGKVSSHYDPDLCNAVKAELATRQAAPEGWVNKRELEKAYQASFDLVNKTIEALRGDYPEELRHYRASRGPQIEYIGPRLQAAIKERLSAVELPPEGWLTVNGLSKALGITSRKASILVDDLQEEHPGLFRVYRTSAQGGATHASPEGISRIREKIGTVQEAPEGWQTLAELGQATGRSATYLKSRLAQIIKEHPEWTEIYKTASHKITSHYDPSVVTELLQEIEGQQEAPEGWVTHNTLCTDVGSKKETLSKVLGQVREEHPEWFGTYRDRQGRSLEFLSPELRAMIREQYVRPDTAPEGWMTAFGLVTLLARAQGTIQNTLSRLAEEHPEWVVVYKSGSGQLREHYHPKLIQMAQNELSAYDVAPTEWSTLKEIAGELGVVSATARKIVDQYREEHPEWFGSWRIRGTGKGSGRPSEHYHPELRAAVLENDRPRRGGSSEGAIEKERLKKSMSEFLENLEVSEGLDAQEFRSLVGLFGAELALDVLYQQHPEYRKLPVPYVKSALADYLGDFLSVRGDFTLDALEKGAPLLANGTFRDAFVEVVKNDCLRLLNHTSRTSPDDLNIHVVSQYMDHIRAETAGFTNPDLEEALNEAETYYQLLFENIHKPDCFVDQLHEGRFFPDINQRINVQEIAFKERVLIADEMGTGKSASAIMAKEIIGARQALVIVPSNVVDTWLGYLSDQVGDNGEQVGYFKPGYTPSVLVVDSLQTLQDAKSADYEYVVISQERLSDTYVEALSTFDYDMLIVDEMHKLKNIGSGKRAASLIALSERIQDEGNYLVLLSGTPVPNKVSDVAMTLKLLYPGQFADVDDKTLVSQILNGDLLNLRSLLVPRMQMKSLAETVEMPEHEEITRTFPLSEKEREIYEILIDEDELTATEKLTILRQCVLNPRFLDATPDVMSSKIRTVSEDLCQTFAEKDKVVMFVNNYVEGVIRGDITILEDLSLPQGVQVLTIDGSVDKQRRLGIQRQLNQGGGKVLLLVSGQTADVGVDFSGAEEVYIYNEPWTMYDKRQQIARVYRPGLKASLKTRTYIAADTIEQGVHQYVESKYRAVEKLLRGVPISEIETEMLRQTEKSNGADVEVNAELAEYYFSSWDKMMKIYGHVKELGEKDFTKFLDKYDKVYAESYASVVGSRSYQANVSRMAASLIRSLADADKKKPETVIVLDVASGPEMLKKHAPTDLADRIVSVDINDKHFAPGSAGKRVVGSFVNLPFSDKSVDYVNMSLGLHYTSFSPRRGNYERLRVLQEVNRVLPVGGQSVISMIYSMDLPDDSDFHDAMHKLGFMVVSSYSGEVTNGKNFKTQLITLKKIRDCNPDTRIVANELGSQGLQSLKMRKTKVSLRNARGILTSFPINDTVINAVLNENDQAVLKEEGAVTQEMENLKQQYGAIENIPRSVISQAGLSRIFNGKRYVLFKRLSSDNGAVVIK